MVERWSDKDPPTPVRNLTGTPMYMAIDVLRGSCHSPSTEVESLFYTILAVCTDGRLSDRGARFTEHPCMAVKTRRGGMTEPELEELLHAPQDKHDLLKTLLVFPLGGGAGRNTCTAQVSQQCLACGRQISLQEVHHSKCVNSDWSSSLLQQRHAS